MSIEKIVKAIGSDRYDEPDLIEIAVAAIAALLGSGTEDTGPIEEIDTALGGKLSAALVTRYTSEESIHALIRLVVERGGPGRTSDQVHELALHHWSRDGLAALELTIAAIRRDIRQREATGLRFES